MSEAENDRKIHDILEEIMHVHERMRQQRDSHSQSGQAPTELDAHAVKLMHELNAKLDKVVEDDVAIDRELDAIFRRLRGTVRRLVREHRKETKEDRELKQEAHELKSFIDAELKAFPGKGTMTAGSQKVRTTAQRMLELLKEKDALLERDQDLEQRARFYLAKALEEEGGQ